MTTIVCYSRVLTHCASVHRDGCAAIGKDQREHGGHLIIHDGDAASAVLRWLGDPAEEGTPANLGYAASSINVCHCARQRTTP